MRIAEILYFAPERRFSELDFENQLKMVDFFEQRINNFYLQPAKKLKEPFEAFAQGLLCVAVIDLLARYTYCPPPTNCNPAKVKGCDFIRWVQQIPGFNDEKIASRFYEDFRCGLVHEGHIKHLGQFSHELDKIVSEVRDGRDLATLVNPMLLLGAIENEFKNFCDTLRTNKAEYNKFVNHLCVDFKMELEASR